MDTEHISRLLMPFLEQQLSESQLKHISTYIDLLLRWSARINLTAIRKEEEMVTRHFGESLFMARHLFPQYKYKKDCHPEWSQAKSEATGLAESKDPPAHSETSLPHGVLSPHSSPPAVIDIGSGAGFPGLPLKLWAPQIRLTLIESNYKKAAFLKEVVRALTLTDVDVITDRTENLADLPKAGTVTLRAVERFETILPQAVSLVAPAGRLALLIGAAKESVLATKTNLRWPPPIPVPLSTNRILAVSHAA
jgi:16S rRNA (guanine527-N7)-methyltransferase